MNNLWVYLQVIMISIVGGGFGILVGMMSIEYWNSVTVETAFDRLPGGDAFYSGEPINPKDQTQPTDIPLVDIAGDSARLTYNPDGVPLSDVTSDTTESFSFGALGVKMIDDSTARISGWINSEETDGLDSLVLDLTK